MGEDLPSSCYKPEEVDPGFAEPVANILLPVLFPWAPLFKPKISAILLERSQLLPVDSHFSLPVTLLLSF